MSRLLVVAAMIVAAAASAAAARPSADVYVAFRTPSGNIGCGFDHLTGMAAHLRCDIRSRLRNPPPVKPKRCDLDYGDSLEMGRTGGPYLVCHGDTAIDPRARVSRTGAAGAARASVAARRRAASVARIPPATASS